MLTGLSACGILMDDTSSIKIENCHLHIELDNYMCCVTKERKDKYWESIPVEQGGPYDCCIEIFNLNEFTEYLHNALKVQDSEVHLTKVGEVFYEENAGSIAEGTTKYPDPFRKPVNVYKEQSELRIVTFSKKATIIPKVVYVSEKYYRMA